MSHCNCCYFGCCNPCCRKFLTDTERKKLLAEYMGWVKCESNYGRRLKGKLIAWCDPELKYSDKTIGQSRNYEHPKVIEYDSWNPLGDWNHWILIERKMMKNEQLWARYCMEILNEIGNPLDILEAVPTIMKADIRTRSDVFISLLTN